MTALLAGPGTALTVPLALGALVVRPISVGLGPCQALLIVAVGGYLLAFSVMRRVMVARPKMRAIEAERECLDAVLKDHSQKWEGDGGDGRDGEGGDGDGGDGDGGDGDGGDGAGGDPGDGGPRLASRKSLRALIGTEEHPGPSNPARLRSRWLWNGEAELDLKMRLAAARRRLAEREAAHSGPSGTGDGGSDGVVRSRLLALLVYDRAGLTPEQRAEVSQALNESASPERRRALLLALQEDEIDDELAQYRTMLTLYRKNWWLVMVALGAVLAVGIVAEVLLMPMLAGAIGGILITYLRLTGTTPERAAFNTKWVVITLAVPIGALGGAAAVVLLAGLSLLDLFGGNFEAVTGWLAPNGDQEDWPVVAAVGFVGGFSARFTERLAQRLDSSVDTAPPSGQPG